MVKKTLIFSLLLLAAMVGPAVALDIPEIYTSIQVNPGLRGDALLAYLYDVRSLDGVSQKTLINIVNTDPNYGVVAKIRFREYKRSVEVLDFHIPFSLGDVWSAEVYRCSNGRAYLYSDDWNSIDTPIGPWPLRLDLREEDASIPCPDGVGNPHDGRGVAFSTGAMAAGEQNIARTLYGYFEIIGEERVSGAFNIFAAPAAGVFGNVARVLPTTLCGPGFTWGHIDDVCGRDAQNSLFGETWLVRVEDGTAQEYAMLALSNFSVNVLGIFNTAGSVRPNLRDDPQGQAPQPGFGGFPQVESVLSKRNIFFQYWDDPDFLAKTSVVATFPTKWAHFAPATRPFVGPAETKQDVGGSDPFLFTVWNREELTLCAPPSDIIFSPFQSGAPPVPRWPFEVNIAGVYNHDKDFGGISVGHSILDDGVIFRDNLLLGSFLEDGANFTEGWINIDLSPPNFADGAAPGFCAPCPNGVTCEQGRTTDAFNFFLQPASATNFTGFRGLPTIGGVLTEVTHAGLGLNYRTAIPWASAVDWPWHTGP